VGIVIELAHVSFPNGRVGEEIVGVVVGSNPIGSVFVTFGNGEDDWTTFGVEPTDNARVKLVRFTPQRVGPINLTITAMSSTGGLETEPRAVTVLAVPPGADVPAGGAPQFRKVRTGASGLTIKIFPTPDDGFWLVSIGGTEVQFQLYDRNGVLKADNGSGPDALLDACVDEEGNIYTVTERRSPTTYPLVYRWRNAGGSVAVESVGSSTPSGDELNRVFVARLNLDGTWEWVTEHSMPLRNSSQGTGLKAGNEIGRAHV
jgi:hypothetical protein